ncbi:MAG TPA: hypothetical protein VF980_07540 [Thermoanaerobaculia bacterium]
MRVPAGFEVETARLRIPIETHLLSDHSHDGSVNDKLYHMKSRGKERIESWKRTVNSKLESVKPIAQQRVSSLRDEVKGQMSSLHMKMRSNPQMWAGIAAGAGLGLGIMGRIMRHRVKQRMPLPHIIVIEAAF